MTPTEDQAEAIASIQAWLTRREASFYVLKGYAGTGKSFCVTNLVQTTEGFRPADFCFTAPTNKAVKVLKGYLQSEGLSCQTATIFSLLGLSLQPNGTVKEITRPEETPDLSDFRCIIVDEASMVNKFLMAEIEQASARFNLPFLFLGDPAQLPPVGELNSPVWSLPQSSTLTKVMRYGDSMLDLATAIRNVVDHPFPSVRITSAPPVFKLDRTQWREGIKSNLQSFIAGDSRIIAWRNSTVEEANRFVRASIHNGDSVQPWIRGDKIISLGHLKDLGENIFLRTDEEAEILEVSEGFHPLYDQIPIWKLEALDEYRRKCQLWVLTDQGAGIVKKELSRLADEATKGNRRLWRDYWKLKEAFHEIRHSYALTSHRAQGSSYSKVFVDIEDIMLNRNRSEAFRSLYVACTRQREELWIC